MWLVSLCISHPVAWRCWAYLRFCFTTSIILAHNLEYSKFCTSVHFFPPLYLHLCTLLATYSRRAKLTPPPAGGAWPRYLSLEEQSMDRGDCRGDRKTWQNVWKRVLLAEQCSSTQLKILQQGLDVLICCAWCYLVFFNSHATNPTLQNSENGSR